VIEFRKNLKSQSEKRLEQYYKSISFTLEEMIKEYENLPKSIQEYREFSEIVRS